MIIRITFADGGLPLIARRRRFLAVLLSPLHLFYFALSLSLSPFILSLAPLARARTHMMITLFNSCGIGQR
jgi:hypothetical protein